MICFEHEMFQRCPFLKNFCVIDKRFVRLQMLEFSRIFIKSSKNLTFFRKVLTNLLLSNWICRSWPASETASNSVISHRNFGKLSDLIKFKRIKHLKRAENFFIGAFIKVLKNHQCVLIPPSSQKTRSRPVLCLLMTWQILSVTWRVLYVLFAKCEDLSSS